MPVTTYASEAFPEKGIRGIQIDFMDTDGSPVVPTAISWTLTTEPRAHRIGSEIINSRENVSVTPASSITIVLSGDDLQILDDEIAKRTAKRLLTVQWTYDSALLGDAVTDYFQYGFSIQNFHAVE